MLGVVSLRLNVSERSVLLVYHSQAISVYFVSESNPIIVIMNLP